MAHSVPGYVSSGKGQNGAKRDQKEEKKSHLCQGGFSSKLEERPWLAEGIIKPSSSIRPSLLVSSHILVLFTFIYWLGLYFKAILAQYGTKCT